MRQVILFTLCSVAYQLASFYLLYFSIHSYSVGILLFHIYKNIFKEPQQTIIDTLIEKYEEGDRPKKLFILGTLGFALCVSAGIYGGNTGRKKQTHIGTRESEKIWANRRDKIGNLNPSSCYMYFLLNTFNINMLCSYLAGCVWFSCGNV